MHPEESLSIYKPARTKALLYGMRMLSFYPLAGTVGILLGGYMQFKLLVWCVIAIGVLVLYAGFLIWLGMLVYLVRKGQISKREVVFQLMVTLAGIIAAIWVIENDILASGARYID